ncbi:hypothetical protein ABLT31_28205 [Ammoniphilus sp. 3BR4]
MHTDLRTGDGVEFLRFHRYYMNRALSWYRTQGLNPRMVRPWSSIPSQIKRHPRWNRRLQDAENRIINDPGSFRSSDELGLFIQTSNLHRAVHLLGSSVFDEPEFAEIGLSPRSTYFYNWHGLIDNWWRQL